MKATTILALFASLLVVGALIGGIVVASFGAALAAAGW